MRTRTVVLAVALVVAGCHRPNPAAGGDLAVVGGEATDLGAGDAVDLGGDGRDLAMAAGPDLAAQVPGKLRIYGGTTSDRWSIVADDAGTAWAIKLDDGTQRWVADHQQMMWATRDVAFVLHGGQNRLGKLELWHKDGPAVHLTDMGIDTTPVVPPMSDGAGHVAYVAGPGGGPGGLVLDTVDHSAPRYVALVQDFELPSYCTPVLRFFAGRLLMLHCASMATTKNLLSSFDLAGTADVDLATDALDYDIADGVGVLLTSKSGALDIVAADGSGKITQTPLVSDASRARFTADRSAAIVVTRTGGMERVDLTSHAVTPLQASGVRHLYHLSNDGRFASYEKNLDQDAGTVDIWMTDAVDAGTSPVQLSGLTSYMFSAFTTDSAFAFWASDDTGNWTGALRARPVAGGAERVISTSCYDAIWARGSRIVYTDNVTGDYPDQRADLSVVDLAGGGAPTKLATQVYNGFDVLSDNATVVYLEPGGSLHTTTLP